MLLKVRPFLFLAILFLLTVACSEPQTLPKAAPSPAAAPIPALVPTMTPDIDATVAAGIAGGMAAIPTATPYPTATLRPTYTPYPTHTRYPTGTPLPTYTPYPTATPYPTPTPYPTATPQPTATPYPTATPRPRATPRPTYTPYPTPTLAPTVTPAPLITSERRTGAFTTPLGAEVAIAVNGPDSPLRYEQLTWAMVEIERLLGVAYPSPRIEMLTDYDFGGGRCGDHIMDQEAGSRDYRVASVTIRLDPDACDQAFGRAEAFHTIVHEVAHSWFTGNADWVDEGLASWTQRRLGATGSLWTAPESIVPRTRCDAFSNIEELEESKRWYVPLPPAFVTPVELPDGTRPVGSYLNSQPRSLCDYTLSAGLFYDLEEHLGQGAFARGAGEIAANLERGRYKSIGTVRTAFAASNARASGIIDLWYEGEPKQRFYDHTDSIEWTEPPTINAGDLVMKGKVKQGTVSIDYEEGYCSQFYLVDSEAGGIGYEYTLLMRLPSARKYTNQGNQIVGGRVRSNGEFEVRVDLLVDPIGDWSVVVWPRTGVSDGMCHRPLTLSEVQVVVN